MFFKANGYLMRGGVGVPRENWGEQLEQTVPLSVSFFSLSGSLQVYQLPYALLMFRTLFSGLTSHKIFTYLIAMICKAFLVTLQTSRPT